MFRSPKCLAKQCEIARGTRCSSMRFWCLLQYYVIFNEILYRDFSTFPLSAQCRENKSKSNFFSPGYSVEWPVTSHVIRFPFSTQNKIKKLSLLTCSIREEMQIREEVEDNNKNWERQVLARWRDTQRCFPLSLRKRTVNVCSAMRSQRRLLLIQPDASAERSRPTKLASPHSRKEAQYSASLHSRLLQNIRLNGSRICQWQLRKANCGCNCVTRTAKTRIVIQWSILQPSMIDRGSHT